MNEVAARLASAIADRYRVEREIGAGGMATVYLAHDLRHDRKVALKILRPELASAIGAQRFLHEIRTTANLQHPNIVPLHDSGEVDGTVFFVMPFVSGESLDGRLAREKQFAIADAVRIASEVASALDYAHRQGVIHRDIKPANILLQDGRAQVVDFGIALAASAGGDARLTETGLSLGTPQYMSPEQAMGERDIDARTDVYSLGCVLYQMLVGDPPFRGATVQQTIARVVADAPRPPRELRRSVPVPVQETVLIALEKLPADRFSTAADFVRALAGTPASELGIAARRETSRSTSLTRGLRRAWRPLAFVLAGAVVSAAVVRAFDRDGSGREAGEPRFFSVSLPDDAPVIAGREHFGTAVGAFALSRDGRQVVYVTGTPTETRLMLVRLDNGTSTALQGTTHGRSPAFAPDGRSIVFVQADSSIQRLSIDDGSVTQLVRDASGSLTWGNDDRLFLSGGCRVVSAKGGQSTALSPLACMESTVSSDAAPIGSRADWMLLNIRGVIQLLSARTGELRPITLPGAKDARSPDAVLRGSSPRYVAPGYLVFARGNTLFAALFDGQRLTLTSDPQPILTHVRREQSGQAQFAVSNDGTLVWADGEDGGISRFVWVTREGRVVDTLFVAPAEVASYALSADGRQLAYSHVGTDGRTSLSVADLERRVVDPIPYPVALHPDDWVRGGRALSATLDHGEGNVRAALVTMNGARGVVDTVTWLLGDESRDGRFRCQSHVLGGAVGSWSPVRWWRTEQPSDTVKLAEAGVWCRFSPDGRFLAWNGPVSDKGEGGIFVAATGGPNAGARVQVAPDDADEPRWTADGRKIVYRRATQWFEVPAPTPDLKPNGNPRLLFDGAYLQAWASWDMGPDGRLLLLQGVPPLHLTRLNVITNFRRYLEQKLAQAR
ncbi:MAG TPA: protein kinase [Gemmatimonadaceae bacterium]|nr:protein kinase [Gemmatimonadaceae bacterium]